MDTPQPRPPSPPAGALARLRSRARAGFTIVEVMVAASVMVFGITSSILVMQSGFRALDTARKTTLASQIMQSEMERIRMLSWSRVQTLAAQSVEDPKIALSTIFPGNTDTERQVLAQMENTFTAKRSIEFLGAYANEIAEITISITWQGIDGIPHTRSSSTRYSKNGLYAYYYTIPSGS